MADALGEINHYGDGTFAWEAHMQVLDSLEQADFSLSARSSYAIRSEDIGRILTPQAITEIELVVDEIEHLIFRLQGYVIVCYFLHLKIND